MNSTHGEHVSKVKISKVEKTLINRVAQLIKPALFDVVVANGEQQYSARTLMNVALKDHLRIESAYCQRGPVFLQFRLVPFVEIINWCEDISNDVVNIKLDKSSIDYIESIISETQLVGRHLTIDDVFKISLVDQAKTFGNVALGFLISLIISLCYISNTHYHIITSYVKKVFKDSKPLVLKMYYVPFNKVYVEDPVQYSHLFCCSEEAITVTFDYRGITSDGFGISAKDRSNGNQKTVSRNEILDDCR